MVVSSLGLATTSALLSAAMALTWCGRTRRRQEQQRTLSVTSADNVSTTQFLAGLHHELRQPLHHLRQQLNQLAAITSDPQQRDLISDANGAAEDLLANLADIFTYLRLNNETTGGAHAPCAINSLLHDVSDLLATRLARQNNTIDLNVDPSLDRPLAVDTHTLRQILYYLIHNAAQATFNGFIKIHSESSARQGGRRRCVITVEHSGLDYTGAIATPSKSGLPVGSALSFALCQQLVQRIDGALTIARRANNLPGLVIRLTFTADSADTSLAHQQQFNTVNRNVIAMSHAVKNNYRVLVAEDNPVNQALMRAHLQKNGYVVDIAADGAETIKQLSNQAYDFVLMDIQMPVMDGLAATDFIRRSGTAWAQIPIIAVTANTMDLDVSCYQALGLDDMITKPVDFALLENSIAKVIAEKGKTKTTAHFGVTKQA